MQIRTFRGTFNQNPIRQIVSVRYSLSDVKGIGVVGSRPSVDGGGMMTPGISQKPEAYSTGWRHRGGGTIGAQAWISQPLGVFPGGDRAAGDDEFLCTLPYRAPMRT